MFCSKCGKELPEDAQFCLQCGHSLQNTERQSSISNTALIFSVFAGVAGLASIILWTIFWMNSQSTAAVNQTAKAAMSVSPMPSPTSATSTPIPTAAPKPTIHVPLTPTPTPAPPATPTSLATPVSEFTSPPTPMLIWKPVVFSMPQRTITLSPGAYKVLTMQMPPNTRNVRLVGKFIAQGGSGNDVYVYVTNEDGLINFKNSNSFRQWYASGHVTTDTLNVLLPPEKAYLIISNRGSIFAHKVVEIDFRIEYERLLPPSKSFSPN